MWQGLVIHTHLPFTLTLLCTHSQTDTHHNHSERGREGSQWLEAARHSLLLFQLLILAGEGHIWKSLPLPLSFPILTLLLQNTKECANGKNCHLGDKKYAFAFPYDSICFHPIKDKKAPTFWSRTQLVFPGSLLQPTQTQTFTSKTEAVGKIFLAAEMGSCHRTWQAFCCIVS